MRVPKINFNNTMNFCAIRKEPTKNGFKAYEDNILKKEVSVDLTKKSTVTDTFDRSGNKIISEQNTYPYGLILRTEREYNSSNQVLKKVTKNFSDEIIEEDCYVYGENGKCKIFKHYDYLRDSSVITRFNLLGKKVSTTETNGDEVETTKYIYDDRGTLKQEVIYDEDKNIKYNTIYEYGWYRIPVKCSHYDEASRLVAEEIYHERSGNLLRSFYIDMDGVSHSSEYFYDAEGKKLMFLSTKENGEETLLARFKYDSDDNLILETRTTQDRTKLIVKYESKTGNVKSKAYYDRNGNMIVAEKYDYDEYGRGVSRTTLDNLQKRMTMYFWDYNDERFIELRP